MAAQRGGPRHIKVQPVRSAPSWERNGLNIKGANKTNVPQFSDVMAYKTNANVAENKEFDAHIQALDIPNEVEDGYSQSVLVRCDRSL